MCEGLHRGGLDGGNLRYEGRMHGRGDYARSPSNATSCPVVCVSSDNRDVGETITFLSIGVSSEIRAHQTQLGVLHDVTSLGSPGVGGGS